MRLLHLDQSGKLVLTDFRGKPIPPYAILSHRWGHPDSEVSFQDLASNDHQKKDGYRKIGFCVKQAAQDQLQYFWIDTCCIDKWNRRELSSSINSMFRWYKNAARCYVFLSDVSASAIQQQSDWEASFEASKWFRRGWTLQELIAPVSVEFFSCEGWQLGDKTTLEQLVHKITSIPLAALRNCPLDQFTTAERIHWAENRETTEEEDGVYCLLGLFDVSMPVSYNEGKEKALRRFLAEVEAAKSAPSIIPFSQNDHFVGREPQLAELEAKLFSDEQTTTIAIVGPGGTGKSQLALELAYRTRQNNQNCSVFWIDASDVDSLYQSYASIAKKLEIPRWDDEKANAKQLVKLHLEKNSARQCLLIFDNTEDMTSGSSGSSTPRAANMIDYLPRSELCSIVFTTTNSNIAKSLASHNIVELWGLTPEASQRMLENYSRALVSSEQQDAKLLLQELSHLPLAIVQAAVYINNTGTTLRQYRSQIDEHMRHTLEHSDERTEDKSKGSCNCTKNPVAATLIISLTQIFDHNALAADYLCLAAGVESKDVPLDIFPAFSPGDRENAIKLLSRYELITRRPAESSFDLNRLVHQNLREWLQKQHYLDYWTQFAIQQLLRVFPDDDHGSRSKWRRLLPHAKYALSHDSAEGEENDDSSALAWKCAMTLLDDGRFDEAEELFKQVMETRKRLFGNEHEWTLSSMTNLALTYSAQGRWKEAEELEIEVIETKKTLLGDEHPSTLTSMGNLATTLWDKGRRKEAEELEVQVMETKKRVLGDEHPSTLITLGNLASTYSHQGRWKEAEELQMQVMETRKRVLGDEHPDTLLSMANLVLTLYDQGQWKKAEELELQVIEMRVRVLGDEHPDTLNSMLHLAKNYSHQEQWQWKKAEELELQVIETYRRALGDKHPSTLCCMTIHAFTLKRHGRDEEAISLMRTCFQLCEQTHGEQHEYTKLALDALKGWQAENNSEVS
ncbi:TPR-like protein [Setomelanomma holmii]|uniref:TPR-like protein n=1 Tax=Setomelanomma holmii TaxID=210430 RepID=A0A9P4LPH8_9PLEO|nr:TPR-like protein [Setomelanomma holmii]